MRPEDIQKRQAEELAETEGWCAVMRHFADGEFARMVCPHCEARGFEYLLHLNGTTIRCRTCKRFIHARGRPKWGPRETDRYVPLPRQDDDH